MELLTIGKLARLTGVDNETIRFYERRGLIPRPPTSPSGYRQYGEKDMVRLVFIRRCTRLGFTLDEIQQLLTVHNGGEKTRSINLDYAVKQISDRLADLENLYEVFNEMLGNTGSETSKQDLLEKLIHYQRWREGPDAEGASS